MENYKLVSDYRDNERLKESFNSLAIKTFQLDFRDWYNRGYWNDRYIPYSFVDGDKIIANASVFKMWVMINGETYKGIQIGTVMTDINYRNQGLAKQLMKVIMREYEPACDFMYLFANDTVLDFYPQFDFNRLDESEFCLDLVENPIQPDTDAQVTQLNIENDLAVLERYAKHRHVNSSILDVKHNESLLLFYLTVGFRDHIYYVENLETIVLMAEEKHTLHIFDIISLNPFDIEHVSASIIKKITKKIVFHFTPDVAVKGMKRTVMPNDEEALFISTKKSLFKGNFKFPITSHC